jgi:NAD(P)-dependent dehydrogenase (short-subunit alcohol dehydrogenase family)
MERGTPGIVVNIGSVAAVTGAPGEYLAYAASKAAVETFTRGLGRELGPQGIRVVAILPGTTETSIHAAAVLWALSDEASYVTGTVISVAGGL